MHMYYGKYFGFDYSLLNHTHTATNKNRFPFVYILEIGAYLAPRESYS